MIDRLPAEIQVVGCFLGSDGPRVVARELAWLTWKRHHFDCGLPR